MEGAMIKPLKGGQPRCLLLTDAPRLFYVDAASLESKELHLHAEADPKLAHVLELRRKTNKVRAQVVLRSAAEWAAAVSQAATGSMQADGTVASAASVQSGEGRLVVGSPLVLGSPVPFPASRVTTAA
jgi:hypothetical protein